MFKLTTSDRLSCWRTFRLKLANYPLDQAIDLTQELWNQCSFHPYYLDNDDPKSWPDPWQLIYDNYYCDLAKCLGIVYTLHLSTHCKNIYPEIQIYYNSNNRHIYHIVYLCQGKYVLNLVEGEVVNKEHIDQELKLKYCYTSADLILEQY